MSALLKALARGKAEYLFDKYKETKPFKNLDICLRISKEEMQKELMEMFAGILLECENYNKCQNELLRKKL